MPWRGRLAFLVDLQENIAHSLSLITLQSPAVTKVYDYYKPKDKSRVFNFKKLKAAPIVQVHVRGKQYTIDLTKHDFSNIYSWQKIFFLEPDGIRSLTDD